MKRILIVGATSAIAEACAHLWAREGASFYLIARNIERLQTIAADLKVRGAQSADFAVLDVNDFSLHKTIIDNAIKAMGCVDIAFIAHGSLGNQELCAQDFDFALRELNTNAISVISLLTYLANHFQVQKHGAIVVISSVAGDRGRQSNYVYGAAKSAVSIFLQGLRQRLDKCGVSVLTVKPGFVDTPMTSEFKKGVLWVTPDAIAPQIVKSVKTKRDVIYTPAFWFYIMMFINLIPERLFKKLRL